MKYDVVVIGSGPGGYVAAIKAAKEGLVTAIIEKDTIGGTCLNRGCIPTKSLLYSAELFEQIQRADQFGIDVKNAVFDFKQIYEKKERDINKLRSGVKALLRNNSVEVIKGKAKLKDKNIIQIENGDILFIEAKNIILATGSESSIPPIPGIDGDKVLDSTEFLNMSTFPKSIVIIGGGVIGVEFATIINAFGGDVSIVELEDRLLPGLDNDISNCILKKLEKDGINVYLNSRVIELKSSDKLECTFIKDGQNTSIHGEIAVAAIGRKPYVEGLGLEDIGILIKNGCVKVNDKMQTSIDNIYAIGDVTGQMLLAHIASAQAYVAIESISGLPSSINLRSVPSCVYTTPEIAVVGLTETQAVEKGYKIKTGAFPVSANGKSMIMGEAGGFAKVIIDITTNEVLGCHIIAPRATDMITEIALALNLECTINELASTIHPHPTISEIILEAAYDVKGKCVHKI